RPVARRHARLRARRPWRHLGVRRPQPGTDSATREGDRRFAREGNRRGPHPASDRAVSSWTDVADVIRVRTSRCYAMNSLVATAGGHALVIDPGVLPSEIDDIPAE